ncbi:MAG: DUF5723 family protein, partial [Bacteroidales bacterium]|nr:DUF5723 family protein [Bacteroidales bacterium]
MHINLKASILLALLNVLWLPGIFAQESTGITQGNFAGSTSTRINPANMLQSKLYFDLHLVSINAFGQNDFVYIPGSDFNLVPLIRNSEQLPKYPQTGESYRYYDNTKRKSGSAISNNYALGGFLQTGDHAFAFHTAARSYTTINNLPYEMAVLGVNSLDYAPLQNILFKDQNIDVASLAWGEIGLSYAYAFRKVANEHWAAGITLKYLMGYGGMFGKFDNVDYMVLDRETIAFYDMNADFGFALPLDYSNNDFPDGGELFKGGGLGVDLGITYTLRKEGFQNYNKQRICEQSYKDYYWRLGVSILDLGAISFSKNAQKHEFRDVNALWENLNDLQFDNMNEMMAEVSEELMGDADASLADNKFKIGLPTALSVQFDYHYKQNWYLNATLVQPLQMAQYAVRRPAQLALTPRYETDWFEAMLPVSLYEYQILRVGAAVRLGFLTLGTDRLGTLLGIPD